MSDFVDDVMLTPAELARLRAAERRTKPAEQIKAGDAIVFLGTEHRVSTVEPYDGPFDFIVGVARAADGWGISLERGSTVEVAA